MGTTETAPIRILIVDDESVARAALGEILREEGFPIVEAANGIQALERLEHEDVQLVVTDLRMPQMGGVELIRRLAETMPTVQVIVVTAQLTTDSRQEAARLGARAWFSKPLNLAELFGEVAALKAEFEHHYA